MCGAAFEGAQLFCPEDGTALRAAQPTADLVGQVVAERYKVIRKLGEGGMGQVYLATHVKIGRPSALKVMHPRLVDSADAIGRFIREATNASRIDHANVASIHDFGETRDGLVYLAMEYVEGETLTAIVERDGALAVRRVAAIIADVAAALKVAHALGIVHRDLKPDNVMVVSKADGPKIKVVDFGLAKASGQEGQSVTTTGMVVGTPAYMSPEQVSGEAVGPASDQFSLAMMAAYLLTEELPFPMSSTYETLYSRLSEPPRKLRELRSDLEFPPGLDEVLRKALASNPNDRYGDVGIFADAFMRAARLAPEYAARPSADTVVDARPAQRVPATAVSADKAPRRGPLVGAMAGLAVVGVGGWLAWAASTASSTPIATISGGVPSDSARRPNIQEYRGPAMSDMPTVKRETPSEPPTGGSTRGTVSQPPVGVAPVRPSPATPSDAPSTARGGSSVVPSPPVNRAALQQLEQLSSDQENQKANADALGAAPKALAAALTRTDSARVFWWWARAHGHLGDESAACRTLTKAKTSAAGTSFEAQVARTQSVLECDP